MPLGKPHKPIKKLPFGALNSFRKRMDMEFFIISFLFWLFILWVLNIILQNQ